MTSCDDGFIGFYCPFSYRIHSSCGEVDFLSDDDFYSHEMLYVERVSSRRSLSFLAHSRKLHRHENPPLQPVYSLTRYAGVSGGLETEPVVEVACTHVAQRLLLGVVM